MRGYVLEDKNQCAWHDDVPEPVLGPTDVSIKPVIVAPCTSDLHIIKTMSMPHIKGKAIGHEVAGYVHEVGSMVKDFKPGDRVLVGSCNNWRNPEIQMGYYKYDAFSPYLRPERTINGCFADLYFVPDGDMNLAPIPDNVSWEQAVMLCDMAAPAFECIDNLDIQFGESVAILGVGPVGLMAICGAIMKGAGRIFAIGSRQSCFDVAKEYGATDFINYKEGDIVKQVIAANGGKPVDRVALCGGNAKSVADALAMVRMGGRVSSCTAFFGDDNLVIPMSAISFGFKDKVFRTISSRGGRAYLSHLLALVQYGRLHPEKMITGIYHGREHLEEALFKMGGTDPDTIKTVVFFEET